MYGVMIVDDNPYVLRSLRDTMDWSRYEMQTPIVCENAETAVSVLAASDIDLIFIDIKLPGMSGIELTQYLHEISPWIVVVIISAYDEFSFAQQCITLGVKQYLLKPIDMEELAGILPTLKEQCGAQALLRRQAQEREHMQRLQSALCEKYRADIDEHLCAFDRSALIEDVTWLGRVCAGNDDLFRNSLPNDVRPQSEQRSAEELVDALLKHRCADQFGGVDALMHRAVAYIDAEYASPLSLVETAARFCVHPTYFSAMMKKTYGLSFTEYLLDVRMRRAQELLRMNVPASAVAERVGYENYKSFYKAYRKRYGQSPTEPVKV